MIHTDFQKPLWKSRGRGGRGVCTLTVSCSDTDGVLGASAVHCTLLRPMAEFISIKLSIQWNGKPYEVSVQTSSATVGDVKLQLQEMTNVLVARQKLWA
jgi:hypothetical protein